MIVLHYRDWLRRSPFFLLIIFWLHLHYAKAGALVVLAKDPCLQPCFMPTCSDLDADCVCNSLLDTKSFTKANICTQKSCDQTSEKHAFARLAQECSVLLSDPSESSKGVTMTRGGLTIISTTLSDLVSLTETAKANPRSSKTSQVTSATPEPAYPTELGRTSITPSSPTATPTSTGSPDLQDGPFTAEPQVTGPDTNRQHSLIAVYVLVPLSVVIILVTLFFFWRRRKYSRRSIGSFAGVKVWDSSQIAIVGPMDEEKATRFPPPSMSQTLPPPVRRPSMARRKNGFPIKLTEKALPRLPPPPVQRPISTISEVSSEGSPVEKDIGTFQTMDSELQRAFLDVRRGFWPSPGTSSARTSMSWSVGAEESQKPDGMNETYYGDKSPRR